ncbi:MAG: helix-hairpin-helix domain-containing protein [Myxococcota bacterium]
MAKSPEALNDEQLDSLAVDILQVGPQAKVLQRRQAVSGGLLLLFLTGTSVIRRIMEANPSEWVAATPTSSTTSGACCPNQPASQISLSSQDADEASLPLPLDLNRANVSDLQTLPGIGPALAGRIVAYRKTHGAFTQLKGLDRVRGIGPKTMKNIQTLVRVVQRSEQSSTPPSRDPDRPVSFRVPVESEPP